jgi:hypothetical protein
VFDFNDAQVRAGDRVPVGEDWNELVDEVDEKMPILRAGRDGSGEAS